MKGAPALKRGHIRTLARPMTPAGDHMAVFDHCMTSVSETRDCGLETCGLGLKSAVPTWNRAAPGLKSSGPDLKSCSPDLELRDLSLESRGDIAI